MSVAHHDVGCDDVGVVAHRLDKENLGGDKKWERGLNSPLPTVSKKLS